MSRLADLLGAGRPSRATTIRSIDAARSEESKPPLADDVAFADLSARAERPSDKRLAATDEELDFERRRAELQRTHDDLTLRRRVANGSLLAMGAQIVVADAVFGIYGFDNGWDIPAAAIEAWLAATVVQVISVVLVITRYLFPAGGPRP